MKDFLFWQKWLLVAGVLVTLFGVLMALLSGTPLFDIFNRQIDPVFWGARPSEQSTREFQQWMYSVWGATIVGWGVSVIWIAYYPFRAKERWAWNCLAVGLLVWFLLDTLLSARYGVYFNVAFNIVVFLVLGLPLLFSRPFFRHTP